MDQTKKRNDKPPKPDKQLRLVLRTASGTHEENFKADELGQDILDRAIKRFKMAPEDPNRPYEMRRQSDNLKLDRASTLAGMGLADGDVIVIQPTQAIDG